MPSPDRTRGARKSFAENHPVLARFVGGDEMRSYAEVELGRRHPVRTLAGGAILRIGLVVFAGGCLVRVARWARDLWTLHSLWVPAAAAGVALLLIMCMIWRWWRGPWYAPRSRLRRFRRW